MDWRDGVRRVVERDDDQRADAGQDGVEVAAAGQPVGAGQVVHRPMHPRLDPAPVGIQAQRRRSRDDPGLREAERGGLLAGLGGGEGCGHRRCAGAALCSAQSLDGSSTPVLSGAVCRFAGRVVFSALARPVIPGLAAERQGGVSHAPERVRLF
ncbi:MAG: hypothetical protein M5U29_17095 [Anaerolineae bacterium]|nr:hypothetical protein [Anaerolineae bacterium]